MSLLPILIVGDAPTLPTGLGRIARDLAELLRRDGAAGRLPVRVAQLGLKYDGRRCNWHVYPVHDEESWGLGDLVAAWEDWRGKEPQKGVIFSVWDPGRCPAVVQATRLSPTGKPEDCALGRWAAEGQPWPELWGYFAVDAEDSKGALGGPVPETLEAYQRVLAYSKFGQAALEASGAKEVEWLPHGIDLGTFCPRPELPKSFPWTDDKPVVGVVATNTPRKDYGVLFAALAGVDCHLWIHTDNLVTAAWSIPELAEQFGRNNPEGLTVTQGLDDDEMSRWYSACAATVAPGLGEGFGYPIVESLACGTPVVHVNYAGGAEFIPRADWRVPAAAQRLDGPYALVRPVLRPGDVGDALKAAARWKLESPTLTSAYCRGSVEHLDWRNLWPWWREWFRRGLEPLER